MTHGMMKYRGSTRGAVMSDSAVVRRNMRRNETVGPLSFTVVSCDPSFGLPGALTCLVEFDLVLSVKSNVEDEPVVVPQTVR